MELHEMRDYKGLASVKFFEVTLGKDYTVQEFCDNVAEWGSDHRWGSIIIEYAGMYQDVTNYSKGKINVPLRDTTKDAKVVRVEARQRKLYDDGRTDFVVVTDRGI